ncbi:hypothetical protein QAD02_021425 [Eretmocerus hayati]|uniref:Uncharacterized protein n=1 Tax=Eretmocerus hayati TaxID=131215 RepID=A0ACC2PTD5_9HYME|nr:hypothetical protein QAD02_021425 [Eretmocerus hayati]
MDITDDDLNYMSENLHQFVEEILLYYSLKTLACNVHRLLHIVESIHWDPSWAHSAYAFEAANGKISAEIHSEEGIILQKIPYMNLSQAVIDGSLHTTIQEENAGTCSHFARLKNGKFIKIRTFLVDFNSRLGLTECDIFQAQEKHFSEIRVHRARYGGIHHSSSQQALLSVLFCIVIFLGILTDNEPSYERGGVAHVTSMKVEKLDFMLSALIKRGVAEPQTASQQC